MVGVAMGLFDFLRSQREYDVEWVADIRKIVNENMNDKLDVINEDCNTQEFNLTGYVENKENKNILVAGGARSGKTELGTELCLLLDERKIIISFKKFLPTKRDFDIGYKWIDVTLHLPNLFGDRQSFIEAFRTAFFADLSMRGLMIDTILVRVSDVMQEEPNNFEEFYKILDRLAGKGQWEENIKTIIKSKVQLLERATAGAKRGSIDFSKGNIVLDLGNLPVEDSKTFLAEYYLRQINRIEEQEQRELQIRVVIDEAWHLLKYRQQNSIVGTILLQGAYYIRFLCITQNYTHLDDDYRSHFGNIFCFKNNNDEDGKAISSGYGAFIADAVKKLRQYQFLDLKYEFNEEVLEVWKVNYERLQTLKLEAKARAVFNEPDESFVDEESQKTKTEEKKSENLEEKIIEALQKSEVAMYGYQIAKAIGLSPKDAVSARQPLRNLVRDNRIKEIEIQVRKKAVVYYYLTETETSHNFMMQGTEKEIAKSGWKIAFKSTHGTHGYDFLIEKDGKQIIVEVETGTRNTLSEFEKRVAEYDKSVIIVVPTLKQKERYSYLPCVQNGKAKIVLIPEIEEVLKNWQ